MYRRPKFLEVLLDIRQEMAREADYDIDLFAESIRSGRQSENGTKHALNESKNEPDDIPVSRILRSRPRNPIRKS